MYCFSREDIARPSLDRFLWKKVSRSTSDVVEARVPVGGLDAKNSK